MTKKKSSKIINSNVENTINDMNNTLNMLEEIGLVSFYNVVTATPWNDEKGHVEVTWYNHEPDRSNAGKSFTTLDQFQHILDSGAYHALLFDGSIIRSQFLFKKNELIKHSHLWWPSPYNFNLVTRGDVSPSDEYLDFITSSNWSKKISMRSPVRVDFDSKVVKDHHPAAHMHTQHHECRMNVGSPICFNRFIKYIFTNFYPDVEGPFLKLNMLSYTTPQMPEIYYSGTSIQL